MSTRHRVALLGLLDHERKAITTCLRQLSGRVPCYELALRLDDAELLIADGAHSPSVQLVVATERLARTLFVGTEPPEDAAAFMPRPVDVQRLLQGLDALLARSGDEAAVAALAARQRPAEPVVAVVQQQPAPAPTPSPPASQPQPRKLAPAPSTRLPASRRLVQAPAPAPAPPAPEPPPLTALLIDDSELALHFLELRLQPWGLVTERAMTSGRAIELLAKHNYDFVFLDVELGLSSDLDGLALCQHIKRHQDASAALSSAVFLVSAHCTEADRVRGRLAGCDAFLGKPLNELELQRLLLRHGLKARVQPAHTIIEGAPAPQVRIQS